MLLMSPFIKNFFAAQPKDGDPCTFSNNPPTAGIIKNGACIADPGHSGNEPSNPTQNQEARDINLIPRRLLGNSLPATQINVSRLINSNNDPNTSISQRQSNCSVAEDWCAQEYALSGNTNGFYCKVWKAACTGTK